MESMIPFISSRWELRGRAVGSDLGNHCFQFRFDYAEDLEKVLENRPYQYARWMLILQKWEPIISSTFPSQIPFWIQLKGIPLHYWKRELLSNIGREIELGRHCSYCYSLNHEVELCLENPLPLKPTRNYAATSRERPYHQCQDRHGRPFRERPSTKRAETAKSTEPERQKSPLVNTQAERQQQTTNPSQQHGERQDDANQQIQLPPRSNHYERNLGQAYPRRGNPRISLTRQIWREKRPSLVD
ncbi:unnamed protein product [Microthlaspi erraticum]|uniref:DUF4283 domain-containing protein n=1 Tax=Microthlaspi erraticum TaxID=1685480 RepID=A0A6D2KPU3_9BRAS|nr:unnamed protein product [Microthlaspi erraticum]